MPGDILLQPERAESGPLVRGCGQSSELPQLPFLVWFFEEMPRQNRQPVEQPFAHPIRLRQLKDDGMRVYLAHSDRFPADDQQVSLRSVHVFVEIHAEREEHIIRIERLPVRKFQSLPEHECVRKPIGRDFPGLGERRFRQLRCAVDVDEVGLHDTNHLARPRISGNQGIQGLWFATERHDESPSRTARISREHEYFFFCAFLLGRARGRMAEKNDKRDEWTQEHLATKEVRTSVLHVRLPRLLFSILYASPRSCNELARPRYPRKNGTMIKAGRYIHQ